MILQGAEPAGLLPQLVQWANLLAAVATAVLAFVVYLASRSLARAEATREINAMWQSFNEVMLQEDNAKRYRSYFEGSGELKTDYKLQYLIFMLLNNLHAEFVHGKRKLIGKRHFLSTMGTHCAFMGTRKAEVVQLMRDNGYDPGFSDFIDHHLGG